ncbi:MAG: 23S rRNA (uracil(1939)-C(5))-methyltransferase RlmD [Candidatus Acidiferrales bacterium]
MTTPFDIRIEKLVYGGDGLAHHEGRTVFAPYVLPGELVRVIPVSAKKKHVRGKAEEILEASAQRTHPNCQLFTDCGGCHYQHIPYAAQLQFKTEILRETLARIGKIEWAGEIKSHASQPYGYRNRAQWAARLVGDAIRPVIGYFQAASSVLVAADKCPILAPKLEGILSGISEALRQSKLPHEIRAVECFGDEATDTMLLNVVLAKRSASALQLAGKFREIAPNLTSFLVQDEKSGDFELDGPGYIHYAAAGAKYRVGHLSFFQVNRFLIDALATAVVGDETGELALDLFAGVGLFSIPLVQKYRRVVAVEGNVATVRDLEANLKDSPAARPRHSEAGEFLARWKEKPDLVVVDPPRAGLTTPIIERLRAIGPSRITYLSCDPATLARDLAALTAASAAGPGAYAIKTIYLYDIFPQTYHIETLVRLERLD